jgi:uncharacterized protein YdeI (YjbR/CyaY-like superfamily)
MSAKDSQTLEVRTRGEWRSWLQEHHATDSVIWLVVHKRHTSEQSMSYDDAVEEALCFGWIDSIVKRLDHNRYVRKFTPRKADSKWSSINRRRYADLLTRGLLAAPGLERPPTSRSGDAPRPATGEIPFYIEKQIQADSKAWNYFQQLAPSYRRACVGWIDSAKRDETKHKRLHEVISLLAAGKKLGLK